MAKRIDRINEEVLKALSEIIKTVKDPRLEKGLVSITHADVTNDLSFATVYVSFLGKEEDKKDVFKGIESTKGYIRRELARKVKLRYTPELIIKYDDSITYGAYIGEVINKLDIKRDIESDEVE